MQSTLESRILNILAECPDTRYDDMLLALEYYKRYSQYPIKEMPFSVVITNYKAIGLPSFETIRRIRQRVQNLFPAVSRKPIFKATIKIELDNEQII